jgi:hypothetical protein
MIHGQNYSYWAPHLEQNLAPILRVWPQREHFPKKKIRKNKYKIMTRKTAPSTQASLKAKCVTSNIVHSYGKIVIVNLHSESLT